MKSIEKEDVKGNSGDVDAPKKETLEEMYRKFRIPNQNEDWDPSRSLRQPSRLKHVKVTFGTHTNPPKK